MPRGGGIDPHILEADNSSIILFSNYLQDERSADFQLELRDRQVVKLQQIFPAQRSLAFDIKKGKLAIPLKFNKKEVVILKIDWKE
jgi:hypothetical protein